MIHVRDSKLHSMPTHSPPFLMIRPSTTRHSPNLTNQILPFSVETSSRIFLALPQPIKPRPAAFPSPSKALASFNKAFRDKYSPSNRTIITPHRNSRNFDDENINLPLSMGLEEVKDKQGNCHIRVIRKTENHRLHGLLNRFKLEKEGSTNNTRLIKTQEGEEMDFKLNSGRRVMPTARSIIAKMLRKKQEQDQAQQAGREGDAEIAYDQAIKEAITNALPKRAPPLVSHNRAKSVQIDVQSPSKPQSLQNVFSNRPKTPARVRVISPGKSRAQTATAEDIKHIIEVSGLLHPDKKFDSEQNEKRQHLINKVPLLKELSVGIEGESYLHNRYSKRSRNRPKSQAFAMSLSYTQSPMGSIKDKLSSNGFEKWMTMGSTKQIEQSRTSIDRQTKERPIVTNSLMATGTIKEWFDTLTVKGNVVPPSPDPVLEIPIEYKEGYTQKSMCSSRKQKAEEKVKNPLEMKITRFSITPKTKREDNIKKEVKQVVLAQRKKSAEMVEKVVKGIVVVPKKMSFSIEKDNRDKEKGKKREDAWQDNISNVGLDAWEVSPTNENFDKMCLAERVETVLSKNEEDV